MFDVDILVQMIEDNKLRVVRYDGEALLVMRNFNDDSTKGFESIFVYGPNHKYKPLDLEFMSGPIIQKIQPTQFVVLDYLVSEDLRTKTKENVNQGIMDKYSQSKNTVKKV